MANLTRDELVELIFDIYNCPDVMFTIASNDEALAEKIEALTDAEREVDGHE